LVPSDVVTTLTACPAAKNEYCPPGTDAISRFFRMLLWYQLNASVGANGLEKDTSMAFLEVFRAQFLCYKQLLRARRGPYYIKIYRYCLILGFMDVTDQPTRPSSRRMRSVIGRPMHPRGAAEPMRALLARDIRIMVPHQWVSVRAKFFILAGWRTRPHIARACGRRDAFTGKGADVRSRVTTLDRRVITSNRGRVVSGFDRAA